MAIRRRRHGVVRVGADHDHRGRRVRRDVPAALLAERQEQAVQPDPEADAGRRAPAQQLHEAVVPAPAAERLLLALAARDVELERGPRVVVQAADEARFQPIRHAEGVEVGADAREMLGARVAQPVRDLAARRR